MKKLSFSPLLFLSFGLFAQTYVGGILTGNEIWKAEGNPYIVTQELVVPENVTLSINPGVEIRLETRVGIAIFGTLRAIGTNDSIIHFTNNAFISSADVWGGLYFDNLSKDFELNNQTGCILQYCHLEYGGEDTSDYFWLENVGAIYAFDSSPLIDHCLINNMNGNSIATTNNTVGITITNNVFTNLPAGVSGGGLNLSGTGEVNISCNIFHNVGHDMTSIGVYQPGSFVNNIICNCNSASSSIISCPDISSMEMNMVIDCSPGSADIIRVEKNLRYNTIMRNTINNNSSIFVIDSNSIISNNNIGDELINPFIPGKELWNAVIPQSINSPATSALNNWWNSTSQSYIDSVIYDFNDNPIYTSVNYFPFLLSPDTNAPVTPPTGVMKSDVGGGNVLVSWNANPDLDIAGYKIYWGNATGYSFSNFIDVGNVSSFVLTNFNISDSIAVTAYDHYANGNTDQCEGFESWFTAADFSTGFSNVSNSNLVFISPNPTADRINLILTLAEADHIIVKLFDANGKMLQNLSYSFSAEENIISINTRGLSSGLYVLNIIGKNFFKEEKIVISR